MLEKNTKKYFHKMHMLCYLYGGYLHFIKSSETCANLTIVYICLVQVSFNFPLE